MEGGSKSAAGRGSKRKQDLSPRSDPTESERNRVHHSKVPRESEGRSGADGRSGGGGGGVEDDDDRSPLTPDVSIREESQFSNASRGGGGAADRGANDHHQLHQRASTDFPDWGAGAEPGDPGGAAAAAVAAAAAAASYDDRNPSLQAALMGKASSSPTL